jgi:hypothetical protein
MALPVVPIAVGDIVEQRLRFRYLEQTLLNVMHYRIDVIGTENNLPNLAAAIDSELASGFGFYQRFGELLDVDCIHERTEYQIVAPVRFSATVIEPVITSAGAVTDYKLPANVGVVITKKSLRASRGSNGSIHIGGINADMLVGGKLSASGLTRLNSLANLVPAEINLGSGAKVTRVVYSRFPGRIAVSITDAVAQDTARVVRRRTVGVGI